MSALFDFKAFLTVVLLTICTCTYIKAKFPSLLNDRTGFRGLFWKAARIGKQCWQMTDLSCCPLGGCSCVSIHMSRDGCHLNALSVAVWSLICATVRCHCTGERLSPWVALSCIIMGLTTVFA